MQAEEPPGTFQQMTLGSEQVTRGWEWGFELSEVGEAGTTGVLSLGQRFSSPHSHHSESQGRSSAAPASHRALWGG